MDKAPARKIIIAIDGPAGSGKSTLAALLARRYGYTNIETGAMYRALALKAMETRSVPSKRRKASLTLWASAFCIRCARCPCCPPL